MSDRNDRKSRGDNRQPDFFGKNFDGVLVLFQGVGDGFGPCGLALGTGGADCESAAITRSPIVRLSKTDLMELRLFDASQIPLPCAPQLMFTRLGLHGRNRDGVDYIVGGAAAREIVCRFVQTLQNRADGRRARQSFR